MRNNYPKIKFRDIDPLQDYFTTDGCSYSVARLIDDTKHLKPFLVPIAALDLSYEIWGNSNIFDLAFHVKKVMKADLKRPIIISWDGQIADGRHRLMKAIIKGYKTILAVRMTWKPTPDKTTN